MNGNNFIGYEYKEVTAKYNTEALYSDSFKSLGWSLDERSPSINPNNVYLKFKRDRRIPNKSELTQVQQKVESHIKSIEKLENSKNIIPSSVAYSIGLVGSAFMAGATFSFLADFIVACIILAIPGFIAWGVAYLAYLRVKESKTAKTAPMIDREYDAIYEICDKINKVSMA